MPMTKTVPYLSLLIATMLACNALSPQPNPNIDSLQTTQPTSAGNQPPQSEAGVPRVSLEEAKAAFDIGAAIIVDVRSVGAFTASHIPGAVNIQLGEFEINITQIDLPKDEWIITYCT